MNNRGIETILILIFFKIMGLFDWIHEINVWYLFGAAAIGFFIFGVKESIKERRQRSKQII